MEKITYYASFILLIGLITMIIAFILERKQRIKESNNEINVIENCEEETKKFPYTKKLLLTKNEWAFYKELKPIADELKLSVLAKIRVADLVEVNNNLIERNEWQKYFNKINRKHVDFALANPNNLKIELLIELDDNSHNNTQAKRDNFIETLYKETGYILLRTHGTGNLKDKITSILNVSNL